MFIIFFVLSVLMYIFIGISYQKGQNYSLEVYSNRSCSITKAYWSASYLPYGVETSTLGYRVITAYNPVPKQTDSTPCISASGLNVCETKKRIVATNEFPFGTKLLIDGKIWEVQDRTNKRYSHRIDLLMYDYEEAKQWGKKTLKIELIN